MGRNLLNTGIVTVTTLFMCGCSGYSKLLKSANHEAMYRKSLEYYEAGKYQKTIALLEESARYFTGTNKEDSAAYYMATSNYKLGDFETSGMLFDEFRKKYINSPFLEDAEYMYAKGFYFMSPAANRDQTVAYSALSAIDEYLERYPSSVKRDALEENIAELNGKLDDKAYINAKSYYTTGQYKAAIVALKNAMGRYPESPHCEEMMYLTMKSSYLLAKHSIENLQRDRYLDLMDTYFNFISEYPESEYRAETDKMQEEAKQYNAKFQDLDNSENNITTE